MAPSTFIFIGRSGCGKGTQADLLRKRLLEIKAGEALYVETGDVFRNFITGSGFTNNRSREFYESAIGQPSFLACYMWTQFLIRDYKEGMHVIFDGTPRSVTEAKIMETAFSFYGFNTVSVINLEVSRSWSERHLLSRGRSDDVNMEKITKRLDWFDRDILPAIEVLKSMSSVVVHDINGEQSIDLVHQDIMKALSI